MIRFERHWDTLTSPPLDALFAERLYTQVSTEQVEMHLRRDCALAALPGRGEMLSWEEMLTKRRVLALPTVTPYGSLIGCGACGASSLIAGGLDALVDCFDSIVNAFDSAVPTNDQEWGLTSARAGLDYTWAFADCYPWTRFSREVSKAWDRMVASGLLDAQATGFLAEAEVFFRNYGAELMARVPGLTPARKTKPTRAIIAASTIATDSDSGLYQYSPVASVSNQRDGLGVFEVPAGVAKKSLGVITRSWRSRYICVELDWETHQYLVDAEAYPAVLRQAVNDPECNGVKLKSFAQAAAAAVSV